MKTVIKVVLIVAAIAFFVFVPFRMSGSVNGKRFNVSKPAIVQVNK